MINTHFASSDRSSDDLIVEQYQLFAFYPMLNDLLGKIDQYLIILNNNRQIVYANSSFLKDFKIKSVVDVIGQRLGEVLECRFSWCELGCGTSEFCKECGAVISVLKTQRHKVDSYMECVILTKYSKTLELAVTSKHIELDGEDFIMLSLDSIDKQKQTKNLEDILHHDITNVASGIHSMIQLLSDDRFTDKEKVKAYLEKSSSQLLDELYNHKILMEAERKDLQIKLKEENSLGLIEQAVKFAECMQTARGVILYIHHTCEDFNFKTDAGLLSRVLINMLTNALEASAFSQKVTIGAKIVNGEKVFWVHNNAFMPIEIQSKIFRQKFSTRKRNSGFGTYSIRVITEGYLGGRVDFKSDEAEGTVFSITLP
ncbi:MAG: hypothetical protein C0602_00565 [Denitrovibrio sp.]|nr:MAG: hypothetical protein C0602_00565 [Denitrovibrio sp.]